MRSIALTASGLARRLNQRIRIAPTQMYQSMECIWLVLYDDRLLNLTTGRHHRLPPGAAELSTKEHFDALAEAARALCEPGNQPLGLMLPLSRFVYSHYGIQLGDEYLASRELVHSAIVLQQDLLLPAMEQEFALGAAPGRAQAVAFWLPEASLSGIEASFEAAGFDLCGILPRPLAAQPANEAITDYVVVDEDASSRTVVRISDNAVIRVLSAYRQDFENADIRSAWEQETQALLADGAVRMTSADDWVKQARVDTHLVDYLFFSKNFLAQVRGKNRQRQVWAGGAIAAAALLTLSLPFVYQWVDALRLESARDDYRAQARVAAGYQNEILDIEYEWGVVYEYPEADIPGILMSLNSVINNSLTSFSLDGSVIEIQGFTEDPEQLTKLLVAQPLFEKIEQSRSISGSNAGGGDRFGLRITLAGLDYAEYSRKYDFK